MTPSKIAISVAASTHDLTVLETVKQELRITHANDDAFLARAISEQSAVAANFCGRKFAKETLVETFRAARSAPLFVSRPPIVSITSVVEGSTTLDPSSYEFSDHQIARLDASGNHIWWVNSNVVVTYVGGYDLLTTLPREVERAVICMIKQQWFERGHNPRVVDEEVEGVGSTRYEEKSGPQNLPYEAADILRRYIPSYAF